MAAPETLAERDATGGSHRPPPSRAEFEFLLRRAGLVLPQSEYDVLFEGAAYIQTLVNRLDPGPGEGGAA